MKLYWDCKRIQF